MEVAPSIHRLEVPLGDRFVCVVVLVGADTVVVFDSAMAGAATEIVVPYLESLGIGPDRIGWVISSHADFDHIGGNADLRALAPTALFACLEPDRRQIEDVDVLIEERYREFVGEHGAPDDVEGDDWIRSVTRTSPIDRTLADGEQIPLGGGRFVEVLSTPGHSHGHLAVFDETTHTALISDAVLADALLTASGAVAFPPTYRYVEAYRATIDRLKAMPIETLVTGHFPVLRGPFVAEFFERSIAFCDRFDDALAVTLREAAGPLTTQELLDLLGPELGSWPAASTQMLAYPLVGHLERLEAAGHVGRTHTDGRACWHWEAR